MVGKQPLDCAVACYYNVGCGEFHNIGPSASLFQIGMQLSQSL